MFNQKNEIKTIMQCFNAINMMYVSYHYYTNPHALFAENGFSFLCSLINFYSLGENRDLFTALLGQYMSAMNMGSIGTLMALEKTQIPAMINIWQLALTNPITIVTSLYGIVDDREEISVEAKNK